MERAVERFHAFRRYHEEIEQQVEIAGKNKIISAIEKNRVEKKKEKREKEKKFSNKYLNDDR